MLDVMHEIEKSNMKPTIRFIFFLYLLASLFGCDFSGAISTRSGTLDNDYVEEPLSGNVEKFGTALVTSNNILHLMSQSKFNDIYRIYFSESMKSQMSKAQFRKLMDQIRQGAGPLKGYKEMQWNFFNGSDQGIDLLYSVKISEHEKTMMKYLFVFEKDRPYINLVGFFAKEYEGVTNPGQF